MLGLESYMAARLGVPVELWNVFDNPALDTSAFAPSFLQENHSLLTTGVGLALKELTEATLPRLARRSAPLQAAA